MFKKKNYFREAIALCLPSPTYVARSLIKHSNSYWKQSVLIFFGEKTETETTLKLFQRVLELKKIPNSTYIRGAPWEFVNAYIQEV